MFYQNAIDGLIKEAKKGLRFKDKSNTEKVFLIIGLIPLIVLAFGTVVSYYVLLFLYKGCISPLEMLHKTLKDEAEKVKTITQAVVYLIAFPFVFLLYVLQSLTAVLFYFQWFNVMIFMYLVTLGGVKFQPFLMDAKYEKDEEWELKPSEGGSLAFTIVLLVFDGLLALSILFSHEIYELESLMLVSIIGILIMLFIVNPIVFKKKALPVLEEVQDTSEEDEKEEVEDDLSR